MNRISLPHRTSLRRLAALTGGALVGVAAALTFAAPASAHHPIVEGEAVCDTATGEWVVTWHVRNSESDLTGKLTEVTATPAGAAVSNITAGATLPKSGDGALEGTQRVSASEDSASLTVGAEWFRGENHITKSASGTVEFGGKCQEDKVSPSASFASACDGTVTVTLSNDEDATKPADFVVTGEAGFEAEETVAPGEEAEVTVPAKSAGEITVTVDDEVVIKSGFEQPDNCAEPSLGVESTCDALIITLENPEGLEPLEVTLTPSGGETETVTVAPGSTEKRTFPAEEGTVVTLGADGESVDIPWEQPEDCGGAAGDLPVTGASVTGSIGVAAGLLAVGAGLFFFFRRRRIRFTA